MTSKTRRDFRCCYTFDLISYFSLLHSLRSTTGCLDVLWTLQVPQRCCSCWSLYPEWSSPQTTTMWACSFFQNIYSKVILSRSPSWPPNLEVFLFKHLSSLLLLLKHHLTLYIFYLYSCNILLYIIRICIRNIVLYSAPLVLCQTIPPWE